MNHLQTLQHHLKKIVIVFTIKVHHSILDENPKIKIKKLKLVENQVAIYKNTQCLLDSIDGKLIRKHIQAHKND